MPMSIPFTRRRLLLTGAGLLVLMLGVGVYAFLNWRVRQAVQGEAGNRTPLTYLSLPMPTLKAERWASGEVDAVAVSTTSLISAGGSGVWDESGDISAGLPTLKVSAMTLWRGRTAVGLASGGLFVRRDEHWEEVRMGFGTLHIRALLETPGGELLIGAREGLFRMAWGASTVERLDKAQVRCLALGPTGLLLAGGEDGLRRIEGDRAQLLPTPDPWVDFVGLQGSNVLVSTPLGLAAGPLGGTLLPLTGGQDTIDAAVMENQVFAVMEGRLLRFEPSGIAAEEFLPSSPRRVFNASGILFVDTPNGLYRKNREGWTLARHRAPGLPPGPSHITALASLGGRLTLGLFDGGLVVGSPQDDTLAFSTVPGSTAWGVNALMPSGGVLYVASLRGTARFDGNRIESLSSAGTGGAYALAFARDGVVIGTGQGVLLADGHFLSAFHGLPGNQALALATKGEDLFVGTPSGLGAVRNAKVTWRAETGDGRLPNPWITALTLHRNELYVGTYGGGVTRRTTLPQQEGAMGVFSAFPETQGLKVNTGCLVEAGGRLFLGTEGKGLHVLSSDGSRFIHLDLPLPSPRVTALFGEGDWLYIGTDEGLTRLSLRVCSKINLTIAGGQPRDPTEVGLSRVSPGAIPRKRAAKGDAGHPSSRSTQSGARLTPALPCIANRLCGLLLRQSRRHGSLVRAAGLAWRCRGLLTWNRHACEPSPSHACPALRTIAKVIFERTLSTLREGA